MDLPAKQATLAFLLSQAFKELYTPRMLVIEHSFGDGFFCHEAQWETITEEEVKTLEGLMRKWLNNKTPIRLEHLSKTKVIEEFYKSNSYSKLEIAKQWEGEMIPIIRFGKYWDYRIEPMAVDKKQLKVFKLQKYNDGFLIRFPTLLNPDELGTFQDHPKLFSIMEEHEQWGSILGVSTIRQLNKLIRTGEIKEMLWVAEGLHEKKISDIADELVAGFPGKRVICIAGPSSSGKTTFAKRLGIQLRVNGFRTHQLSMDDYFIDRKLIPVGPDGKQDFESIEALDVELLSDRLDDLLRGNSIPRREFNFKTGKGHDLEERIQLGEWDFVVMEGIHGLNPVLSDRFGSERLQRIYVSAITQLNVDANHRISTSDNRLLRRLVRDHKFRGYTPEQTLERWPSVRMGEEKNIFPHQEQADFMFNTSLVYEFPVLARYARPLLKNVRNHSAVGQEAKRLELLLSFFEPLEEEAVPGISILREFIGKSEFDY